MTNSDSLSVPYPEPSFLRFGTWSILLHVGAVALLSFLHFSHSVEKPKPLVRVTLIEPQAPTPPKEAEPQAAPPMHQTQRRQQPVQPQQIMPPPRLRVPAEPTLPAKVIPQRPQRQSPQPLKRRVLQDERAGDVLRLKNFTKVARGNRPPTRARTGVHNPSMTIPALSTLAALEGVSTKVQPLASPSRVASAATKKTLRSVPTSKGPSKTGVGLKRHIPPVYPGIAKKENWKGTVVLRVAVQPNGRPEVPITVQRSSGHQVLDDAAIAAVTRWTFHPAKDGNIPIRSIVEIPIEFALTEQG